MLDDAVSFHHGVLGNLRAVAHGRDGVIVETGYHAGVAVHFGAVAHPDVVEFVTFEDRAVEHFGAVLNKRVIHHRLAVYLCLMHNARSAYRRLAVNLQDLVVVRREAFSGNDDAVVQDARVAVKMALTPHAGVLNCDVVTYSRPVADLCGVKPAVIADMRVMADGARQGQRALPDTVAPANTTLFSS